VCLGAFQFAHACLRSTAEMGAVGPEILEATHEIVAERRAACASHASRLVIGTSAEI